MSLEDRIFTCNLSEKYPEVTPTYKQQENKSGGEMAKLEYTARI